MPSSAPDLAHPDAPVERLRVFVTSELTRANARVALDAGCGFALPFRFPPGLRFVGLDASAEALAKNPYIAEAIVGDVETYPLPAEAYDAVLCWTVLEHVADPRRALANMAGSLKPGGLLIVGVPNVWSLKGIVTKITPYRFHVWAYRRLLGYAEAGTPGHGPYRTYLRSEIAPARLASLAAQEGLERVHAETYALPSGLPPALDSAWRVLASLGWLLTLGRWNARASEHLAVYRKTRR